MINFKSFKETTLKLIDGTFMAFRAFSVFHISSA